MRGIYWDGCSWSPSITKHDDDKTRQITLCETIRESRNIATRLRRAANLVTHNLHRSSSYGKISPECGGVWMTSRREHRLQGAQVISAANESSIGTRRIPDWQLEPSNSSRALSSSLSLSMSICIFNVGRIVIWRHWLFALRCIPRVGISIVGLMDRYH